MDLGRNTRAFNYLLLFSIFILQVIDNYCRDKLIRLSIISNLKNIMLVAVPIIFLLEMNMIRKKRTKDYIFKDELKYIILLTGCFTILSLYYIVKNRGFEMITLVGLIKIIMPIIVAFFVINIMSLKDIYKLMSILLIITFGGYLISITDKISIENILSINWLSSHSAFESTFFSPTAISFCLFFCYFRKHKFYTYLSVLFTIMTFKRIMVIYSLFLLIFGSLFSKTNKVPKWIINLFMVTFLGITVIYINLMLGNINDFLFKYIGIDINSFSMGRAYLMQVISSRFTSLGFMSSTVNYRSMEMDLPMIYVEMGIISVIATIYFLTKIAKENWYNFLIIIFCLLELLTSHWFDITYFWIVAYITIGSIQYKQEEVSEFKKSKIKFVLKEIN